jgi:cytochrome c peroxidase
VRGTWCALPLFALLACGAAGETGEIGDVHEEPHAPLEPPLQGDGTSKEELAPLVLPAPPPDVSNRYADDAAAAVLGQKLFYDPAFSGALLDLDADGGPDSLGLRGDAGKVSCAGCHEGENGFLDTRSVFKQISLGTGWTHRRTPTLLDVGQAKVIMWGGRHSTLHSQVFGPLESPLEMNSSRLFVAQRIAQEYAEQYEAVFGAGTLAPLADEARFPPLTALTTGCRLAEPVDHPRLEPPDPLYTCHGMPGDGAEYDAMSSADQDLVTRIVINMGKAIAAFERQLGCGPSRFDAWVHGDAQALSAEEQRGFDVFVGKGGCVTCHNGPYFSDQKFHNVGLAEGETRAGIYNGDDRGAALDLAAAASDPLGVAGEYSDGDDDRLPADVGPEYEGAFRTPTLRCVGTRPSFMHSGLLLTLSEVVDFFDRGGDPSGSYLGESVLQPLGLTDEEKADLVLFLNALEGPGPPKELLASP